MSYTAATVNAWYQAVQFRDGPAATVASTVALLNSGGITPANAQLSIINDSFTSTYVNPMIRIYQAAFNRVPDQAGQNFWVDSFAAGSVTTLTAATNFANSTEFNATYGANASSPINAAVLTAFYQNVLNRAPDAAGYQFWLNSGQTVAQVLNYFAQSTEFTLASASAINQFQAAEIAGNPATSGSLFQYGGFPTDSVALTTGVDTLNLLKNTTVTGIQNTLLGATDTTYQTFDTITGAAGTTNALNVTLIGDGTGVNAVNPASVSGVQSINIRNVATGGAQSIKASTYVGATSINAVNSTRALDITDLASGQAVGITGNGSTTNAAVTADYVAAATTAQLNLSTGVKGGADVITGAGLKTLNVNSSGAVNTLTSLNSAAGAGFTTVNVVANTAVDFGTKIGNLGASATINVSGGAANQSSSKAAVALGTLDGAVATVDASKLVNGGISATLSAAAQKVTGGQGNDFITTGGVVLTGSVDAGAGTADTLIVTAAADVAAAPAALYSNFEVLNNSAAATIDASLFTKSTIGSIKLGVSGAGVSGMTAAQALKVTNLLDNAGATLSLKDASGAADVLDVTLQNASATTSADLTTVTVTGFETLKVHALSGGTGQVNDISFTAAANLKTLTIDGTAPVKVLTTNLTSVGGTAIDASGITFTGTAALPAFEISGNLLKGSSVVATGTVDKITTTTAVAGTSGEYVTYNAGAGDDGIFSTVAAINNTGAGNASLKIDGGLGTDTLTFTEGGVTAVDANFQFLTNIEKLAANAAGNINVTTGGFFDANFKANGVTFTDAVVAAVDTVAWDSSTFTGNATLAITSLQDTTNTTITTGGGADSITLSLAAHTTGVVTVSAGAGNDKIAYTGFADATATGDQTISGGLGQDAITLTNAGSAADTTANDVILAWNAGDASTTSFDTVKGYVLGAAGAGKSGNVLDLEGATAVTVQGDAAAVAVTGYTGAELTYSITNGLLTFAGTKASSLTVAQEVDIALTQILGASKALVFQYTNADTTVDSYVVENGATAAVSDTVVQLVGTTALGAQAIGTGAGAGVLGYINVA